MLAGKAEEGAHLARLRRDGVGEKIANLVFLQLVQRGEGLGVAVPVAIAIIGEAEEPAGAGGDALVLFLQLGADAAD